MSEPNTTEIDVGLSHVALPVTDLDASIAFYSKFAKLECVHRRQAHQGHGVAWLSDLTRPFVVVLLEAEDKEDHGRLSGWSHLGVGCLSRDEVDGRLAEAVECGHEVVGPCEDGPPVGYWGMIVDPDGHNLELSYGQQVGVAVSDKALTADT